MEHQTSKKQRVFIPTPPAKFQGKHLKTSKPQWIGVTLSGKTHKATTGVLFLIFQKWENISRSEKLSKQWNLYKNQAFFFVCFHFLLNFLCS